MSKQIRRRISMSKQSEELRSKGAVIDQVVSVNTTIQSKSTGGTMKIVEVITYHYEPSRDRYQLVVDDKGEVYDRERLMEEYTVKDGGLPAPASSRPILKDIRHEVNLMYGSHDKRVYSPFNTLPDIKIVDEDKEE